MTDVVAETLPQILVPVENLRTPSIRNALKNLGYSISPSESLESIFHLLVNHLNGLITNPTEFKAAQEIVQEQGLTIVINDILGRRTLWVTNIQFYRDDPEM